MSIIEAKDITLAYDGYTAAEHVSFKLEKGDYLCVVGENGSGKSTLLKAVTGEIKPAAGELIIDKTVKKEGIGYLPQQSKIQRDFPATVREVVLSGCVNRDRFGLIWNDSSKKRARDAMEMMNLLPLEKKCFGELSGGQKQRTLLARAICASDIVSNHHDGAAQLTVYLSYSRIHLVRGVGVKSGHRLVEKEQLIGGAYCSR